MRLFIAEKPSVARAIAAELGVTTTTKTAIQCADATVTWCFGHLLEQAEPDAYTSNDAPKGKRGRKIWRLEDLPIVPRHWQLVERADTRAQLRVIGRLLRQADEVVHAGDPDREGQLLVDEVLEHFAFDGHVRRFWVSAQDPVSIRRGLAGLQDNARFSGMADAARGRQRADWLVGMNLSRAYTLCAERAGAEMLLTVGRVQTPTLALVVARDRDIERFQKKLHYLVDALIEHEAGELVVRYVPAEDAAGVDEHGHLIDRDQADAIARAITGQSATVTAFSRTDRSERPPLGLTLSDLTVLASARFGYSAAETLDGCQCLYETHKLISYPRTDCGHLPRSQHGDARQVLDAIGKTVSSLTPHIVEADPDAVSAIWNDVELTAHHAIVPTRLALDATALGERERRLYELIARRYVAQFLPDHEYQSTKLEMEIQGLSFTATARTVVTEGWRAVDRGADGRGPAEGTNTGPRTPQTIPQIAKGDVAKCLRGTRKDETTKPPPRFTEGSLVRAMERIDKWVEDPVHRRLLREGDGLGTAATRAAIVSDLKSRKFLIRSGKHVVSTRLARALVDVLPDAVKSPTLTALYERMLREVEAGTTPLTTFVDLQARFVTEQVATAMHTTVLLDRAEGPDLPKRTRRSTRPRRGESR